MVVKIYVVKRKRFAFYFYRPEIEQNQRGARLTIKKMLLLI
jgi:hypothetical protein